MPSPFTRLAILALMPCLALPVLPSEVADSVRTVGIDAVTVTADRRAKDLRAAVPTQALDAAEMRSLGAQQLSDAVKMMSGVVIKDYGGIGGLKTVSVRSLGAAHTGMVLDGVPVTDAQTGQIDLGRFALDGVETVTLSSGQEDGIFMTARQYASASTLAIRTARPTFMGKAVNIAASVKGGSFGFVNPSLRLDGHLGERLALSVSGDYTHVRGDYPYRQDNGNATVERRRENSDIDSWHVETDLFGHFDGGRELSAKAYYYASERGLPTNILYNEFAGQRLWDKNGFVQAKYVRRYNHRWALSATAKWNRSRNRYYDPVVYNAKGYDDQRYRQDEGYLSAVVLYRPLGCLSFSLAADGIASRPRCSRPPRMRPCTVASPRLAAIVSPRWCRCRQSLSAAKSSESASCTRTCSACRRSTTSTTARWGRAPCSPRKRCNSTAASLG